MKPFKNYYNDDYKRALLKSTAKFVSKAGFAVPLAGFKLPPCVLEGITNILNPTQQTESKLLPREPSIKHHQSLKAQPSVRSMFF